MIGSVMFIRLNWLIKSVLNMLVFGMYLVVVLSISHCLFDNFDKSVYGICTKCDIYLESRTASSIQLAIVLVATILLGRHVCCLHLGLLTFYHQMNYFFCRWIIRTEKISCGERRLVHLHSDMVTFCGKM